MRHAILLLIAIGCADSSPSEPLEIEGFEASRTVSTGSIVTIAYRGTGAVDLFADTDGDLDTLADQVVIARSVRGDPVEWDTSTTPPGSYRIVARDADGEVAVSAGMVTLNATPTAAILRPTGDAVTSVGNALEIDYTDDDPDDDARTSIFADGDGDPATTADQYPIVTDEVDGNGAVRSVSWDTRGVPLGVYTLFLKTGDALSGPGTRAVFEVEVIANVGRLDLLSGYHGTQVLDVRILADGSRFITGAEHDPGSTGGVHVARYRPDGALDWESLTAGPGNKSGQSIDVYPDGSTIASGLFDAGIVFGPGEVNETTLNSASGKYDAFLARYNADGTLAWAVRVGDTEDDVGVDAAAMPDGGSVWGGRFRGTATFAAGASVTSAGDSDLYLARHAADGTHLWTRAWGSTGTDSLTGIGVMPDGSLVVTGYFENTVVLGLGEPNETTLVSAGSHDFFIARVEADGALRWARRFGGPQSDSATRPVPRPDGSFVLSGTFAAQIEFGATTLQSAGQTDIFVAQFDGAGDVVFARAYGDTTAEAAVRVAAHTDGSLAVAGYLNGPSVIGSFELPHAGNRDILTAVFEPDGALRWIRSDGGPTQDTGLGIGFLPDGTVLAVGQFGTPSASATFGLGEANETTAPGRGGYGSQGYLVRFNLDGKY